MAIEFERAHDGRRWGELVDASPGATSFHDWDWLHLMASVFDYRLVPLIVTHDGRAIGVFPILMKHSVLPRAAEPPFPYVGPLVPPELLTPTLRAFRHWQMTHGLPFVRFDFGPLLAAEMQQALSQGPVEWKADRSIVVDLEGHTPATLVARMRDNPKKSLRKAERNGVVVRQSLPGELSVLLPRILHEAYTSHGVQSPYPDHAGARIEEWAAGRDDVYIGTALVHGEAAGVMVGLGSHSTAMAWVGGALREFRAANPNTLLYYDLILWALERGHPALDLVGYVDDRVAQFKMSLGGVERPYLNAISNRLPRGILAAAGAVRARRARRARAEAAA
jgi:hypothetical protein